MINALGAEAFWRNRREVDAIVNGIPVEVKYQEKVIKSDLKGIIEFMGNFNRLISSPLYRTGRSFLSFVRKSNRKLCDNELTRIRANWYHDSFSIFLLYPFSIQNDCVIRNTSLRKFLVRTRLACLFVSTQAFFQNQLSFCIVQPGPLNGF